jgi:glycine zipper 2TM protein
MMKLRNRRSRLTTTLAAMALAACVQGEQTSQSADSTARNLTLAPTESTAALKDVPAPATEAAKPALEKKAPVKKPAAPKPAPLMLAAGTRVPATAGDTISTRKAKAGDPFSATVSQDVKDATGRVVIPAGAMVSGTISAAEPAPNPNSSGRIELAVTSVTVRGVSYPIDGSVVAKDTVMKGRGVTGADAAKVGGGAVAGAIVGKLIGKNKKGAVIGGVAGAAAGAAAARQSRDIDVVMPKGAALTIRLNAPLTVKAA